MSEHTGRKPAVLYRHPCGCHGGNGCYGDRVQTVPLGQRWNLSCQPIFLFRAALLVVKCWHAVGFVDGVIKTRLQVTHSDQILSIAALIGLQNRVEVCDLLTDVLSFEGLAGFAIGIGFNIAWSAVDVLPLVGCDRSQLRRVQRFS